MKAILLSAGQSKRLYPLTQEKPKNLLLIDDKTLLDHQMEALVANKVTDLVIVVGCFKELIQEHLANKAYPIKITYIVNDDFSTTGPILGGLARAKDHLTEPIVFFHCDVLFDAPALAAVLEHPEESVMLYRPDVWDAEAGKIIVEPDTHFVRECGKHVEQARASGEYLQIAKFGPDFRKRLIEVLETRVAENRDGFTIDAFNEVVQDQRVHVVGLPYDGVVLEIDTPEDYENAKKVWQERA
ncbi:MAG: NTP transferase domain-containing protein [Candidatus Pacebacteria bacterium]|nr:NTP transferase domain-containing protein [Candidatus Paceibacterota bacterium]MBP9840724.1 NTP transferase domain-containing protein [Candidatus Paceibacterota bacterium]